MEVGACPLKIGIFCCARSERIGRAKWRKAGPSRQKLTRDELISRLAVAESRAGRAWKMISLTIPKADEEVTPETFRWRLDWERIREARAKDEGTHLLRTNLEEYDPKTLWRKYMIQGEIEYAFRELKGTSACGPCTTNWRTASRRTSSRASWRSAC